MGTVISGEKRKSDTQREICMEGKTHRENVRGRAAPLVFWQEDVSLGILGYFPVCCAI